MSSENFVLDCKICQFRPKMEVLASGGNDNLLCLWDASASSSSMSMFIVESSLITLSKRSKMKLKECILNSSKKHRLSSLQFWNCYINGLFISILFMYSTKLISLPELIFSLYSNNLLIIFSNIAYLASSCASAEKSFFSDFVSSSLSLSLTCS